MFPYLVYMNIIQGSMKKIKILITIIVIGLSGCSSRGQSIKINTIGELSLHSENAMKIKEDIYYLNGDNLYLLDVEGAEALVSSNVSGLYYEKGCYLYLAEEEQIIQCNEEEQELFELKAGELINYPNIERGTATVFFLENYVLYTHGSEASLYVRWIFKFNSGVHLFGDNSLTDRVYSMYSYYDNEILIESELRDYYFKLIQYSMNFDDKDYQIVAETAIENETAYVMCAENYTKIENQLIIVGYYDNTKKITEGCWNADKNRHEGSYILEINLEDINEYEMVKETEKGEYIIQVTEGHYYVLIDNMVLVKTYADEIIKSYELPKEYKKQKKISISNIGDWMFIYGDNNELLLRVHILK